VNEPHKYAVRTQARAKINLLLRILARESSGYHQIETVFQLLDLADDVAVTRTAGGVQLDVQGPDLGPVTENLAVRAAELVLEVTGRKFGVAIELTKRIPVRAGLGGGSSDAAAVLHAVNALADNAVPPHELMQLGTRLGADVAFFASGAPAALAWGRGERLFRLTAPPQAPVLIAVPALSVSTPDAYGWWDEMHARPASRGPIVLDAEALSTWGGVGRLGGNDFETPVFGHHPEVRSLYERLAETRPLWVRMSGSGAAVAAVYKNERERDDAAARIGSRAQRLYPTSTRSAPPQPPAG